MVSQVKLIEEILNKLKYNARIPKEDSINGKELEKLLVQYGKTFLTASMIKDVIFDTAFEKKLAMENPSPDEFTPEEVSQLAQDIEAQIHALPEDYTFYFRLPSSKLSIGTLEVGPRMTIFSADGDLPRPEPNRYKARAKDSKETAITTLLGSLTNPLPIYKKGDVILSIKSKGLITKYSQVKLDGYDPLFFYKIILYLLVAQNTFERAPLAGDIYGIDPSGLSYTALPSNAGFARSFSGDSGDTRFVASKHFNQAMIEGDALSLRTDIIKKLLTKLPKSPGSSYVEFQRQLRNSAYWCYENAKATETHTRIVYICTAFDALIGSQNESKEYKAEIISQSLSNTIQQEESYRKIILALYALRNGIVHGSVDINTLRDQVYDEKDSNLLVVLNSNNLLQKYFASRLTKFNESI